MASVARAGAFDEPAAAAPPARPAMLDRPSAKRGGIERELLLGAAMAGKRLVAVGASGHIVLSDDGGRKWRQARDVPTSAALTGVRFTTENDGWAIGHLGVALLTRDGGETWSRQLDGVEAAKLMLQSAERRFATDTSDAARIQLKMSKLAVQDGPNKPLLVVVSERPEHAIVLGAFGMALETQDGGKTWLSISDRFENPNGLHYYGYARTSAAQVIVGEQGLILRSTDGKQFTRLESPYEGTLFGVVARPDGDIVAFGLRGNVIQSSDHGKTWEKGVSGIPASIQAGTLLSDGSFLLASETGQLVIRRQSSRAYVPLSKSVQPAADVLPIDKNSLLIVGPHGAERVDDYGVAS